MDNLLRALNSCAAYKINRNDNSISEFTTLHEKYSEIFRYIQDLDLFLERQPETNKQKKACMCSTIEKAATTAKSLFARLNEVFVFLLSSDPHQAKSLTPKLNRLCSSNEKLKKRVEKLKDIFTKDPSPRHLDFQRF